VTQRGRMPVYITQGSSVVCEVGCSRALIAITSTPGGGERSSYRWAGAGDGKQADINSVL